MISNFWVNIGNEVVHRVCATVPIEVYTLGGGAYNGF